MFNDWEGIGSTGVRYLYDLRQKNAMRTQLQGLDAAVSYRFDVSQNEFDLQLNLTHLREILTSLSAGTATFDLVDTYNLPLDWHSRVMGTWSLGGFSSTLAINHADSYINDSNTIDVRVGSWTTADLNVSYDFAGRTQSSLLSGTSISLGISNLTDRDPPRATSPMYPVGYDVFNADAMGRFITARFSKHW